MKLTFLGHAGFIIEHKNSLLLMDPWLSKKGAYDSAWLQFPCNHHLIDFLLDKIKLFDHIYIYISHEHKDHFDPEILSQILAEMSEVFFLIPNFKSKSFLFELQALNPKHIKELNNNESLNLENFEVCLFMDESGINHDSGILVRTDEHTFLNLNDCKIFDRLNYIKNKFKTIDLFTVQFSGASWHPICYEMPEEEYLSISKKKKLSKFRAIINAIKTLKPNRYLPTAGPPALLDPMHYEINFQKESIFPQQFDLKKFLSQFNLGCQIDSIMPGDVYCFRTDTYLTLANERVNEDNYKSIIETYVNNTRYLFEDNKKYIPHNINDLFHSYFKILRAKAQLFSIKEQILHILYFGINEITESYIEVNLNNQKCEIVNTLPHDNYYFISYPAWQINRLLHGQIKGEDLALTFRGKMKRSPDIYNTWISCFVNSELEHLSENIKLIEGIRENKERIEVECNGNRYQIKRFCPHQGADLQYGWAEGTHWVCPKHRWHYDLENSGQCKSSDVSIEASRIVEDSKITA